MREKRTDVADTHGDVGGNSFSQGFQVAFSIGESLSIMLSRHCLVQ
jgi:hypothetical protein